MYNIDISNSKLTLIKNQARTLLKKIFPGEISSWQIYQFRVKYGIEDESYGNYDDNIADEMLLAIKEASKDSIVVEYSIQVIDDANEKSEADNNHGRCKRTRRT
jgi:hypothetical protein